MGEVCGTKQTFSKAKNICNLCENAHQPTVREPCAWLQCECPNDRAHLDGCRCHFAKRTAERDALHQADPTCNALKRMSLGVDTWENAFVRVPTGGRSLAQQPGPKDAMHMWLEGLTKGHYSYTIYMLTRVHKWCTKEQLMARVRSFNYPQTEKPVSRPGFIPLKMFTGTAGAARGRGGRGRGGRGRGGGGRGGRGEPASAAVDPDISDIPTPHKDMTPPYTAHHMLVSTLHSIEMFRPFLPSNASDYPFWRSWVLHVNVVAMLMRPSYTWADLVELDNLQYELHTTFFSVPEYKKFWLPKWHFVSHVASDILKFGPPRLNWCFMYEAKNQPLKRGCKRGNFRNAPRDTSQFWAQSTDHSLRKSAKEWTGPKALVVPGRVILTGGAIALPEFAAEANFMLSNIPHIPISLMGESFKWLASAKKSGVSFFLATYVLISVPKHPVPTLGYINQIVLFDGNIYLWVNIYPPRAAIHDAHGVLTTTPALLAAYPFDLMCISFATNALTALWSFPQPDGSLTFVSKW